MNWSSKFQRASALSITCFTVLSLAILSGCSSKTTVTSSGNGGSSGEPSAGPAKQDWTGKMQELSGALNKLLPLVSDGKEFSNPKNESAINDATARLKALSHQVKGMNKPSADPAYSSIASMLDEDLARAVAALQTGNRDYARLTLRESIGYCIQCHTQASYGPSFPRLNLGFDPAKLSPLGRGDYYAATRQFDAALDAYRSGAKDTQYAKSDVFGWERAARSGLAIAVRFKESPKDAKLFAQAIANNPSAPQSLQESAKAWAKAIDRWAKEKPMKAKGPDGRLQRGETLINEAERRQNTSERGQDILYLRASADLHQWLAANPSPGAGIANSSDPKTQANRAKALYLAGRAAEASRELNFWTLHERYYEMCIEALPKSEVAKQCFQKLNDSVLLGYTGSSGTHLPPEESVRLARLKEKAFGP